MPGRKRLHTQVNYIKFEHFFNLDDLATAFFARAQQLALA